MRNKLRRLYRNSRVHVYVAVAVVVVGLNGAAFVIGRSLSETNTTSDQLCANQHSVVEMQRLFLAEHDAIRQDLRGADIPARHADPHLLEKLRVLIENADCRPDP